MVTATPGGLTRPPAGLRTSRHRRDLSATVFPQGVIVVPSKLRAVAADEKPAAKAPRSIVEAADRGSARDLLVAMRNRIAKTLDEPNCPARDQASLSRRLLEIRKEIEALDAAVEQEAAESVSHEDEGFDASAV